MTRSKVPPHILKFSAVWEDNGEEDNVVTGRSVEGLNDLRPKR